MRRQFVYVKRHKKIQEEIDMAAEVIAGYYEQGYRMTVRQVFYQLVARNKIANSLWWYNRIVERVKMGRLDGVIDWDAIEDRARQPHLQYCVADIGQALEDTIAQYKLDRQEAQPKRLEVWCEKRAVEGILKPVCEKYHIPLLIGGGAFSLTCRKAAADRLSYEARPITILYIGDYDPAGITFRKNIEDSFDMFGVEDFEVVMIALTKEQVIEHNLPPQPVKQSDCRAEQWRETEGEDVCELDALGPDLLKEIIEEAISERLDDTAFGKMMAREVVDRITLKEMVEGLE